MIKWMDRGLQRAVLLEMADKFPFHATVLDVVGDSVQKDGIFRNLMYLHQSGLCALERPPQPKSEADPFSFRFTITTKGLDFLQEDGGLSAILNVVTVRFEADTLRALIAAKIDASSEPEEKKAKAKGLLSTLKEEGLKQLTNKAVGEGLSSLPHIADWVISSI